MDSRVRLASPPVAGETTSRPRPMSRIVPVMEALVDDGRSASTIKRIAWYERGGGAGGVAGAAAAGECSARSAPCAGGSGFGTGAAGESRSYGATTEKYMCERASISTAAERPNALSE
eukprot:5576125-Prymnesium_polylepis.1